MLIYSNIERSVLNIKIKMYYRIQWDVQLITKDPATLRYKVHLWKIKSTNHFMKNSEKTCNIIIFNF